MLRLEFKGIETFNDETNTFGFIKPTVLKLEHSLISMSKWESIWKKPFLHMVDDKGHDTKTAEQSISYVKCMTISQVSEDAYNGIGAVEMEQINKYINTDQTATWFNDNKPQKKGDKTVVTSELIYYWMVAQQIPWEAQKWHLSRLLTLIQICNLKNQKEKKMSKSEVMSRNRHLNEARRKANNSKG